MIVLMGLSERTTGGGEGNRMLESEKYWSMIHFKLFLITGRCLQPVTIKYKKIFFKSK
jgi:hypothetical protein